MKGALGVLVAVALWLVFAPKAQGQDLIIEASGSSGSTGRLDGRIVKRIVEIDRADIGRVYNSGAPGPLLEETREYRLSNFRTGRMRGVYTRGEWQPLPALMNWCDFEGRTSCSWSQGFPGSAGTPAIAQSGNWEQTRPGGVCSFTCPAGYEAPFAIDPVPWARLAWCSSDPPFETITVIGTEFFVSTFNASRWRAWRMDGDAVAGVGDLYTFVACYLRGEAAAEFDGEPGIGAGDLFAFLGAWLD